MVTLALYLVVLTRNGEGLWPFVHNPIEHFMVLYLDRKGGLIVQENVSVGGLHSSIVHPREVFKTAVKRSAASIILAHNHPSGDPAPSQEDIDVTKRLVSAGEIMGIPIIDHIVVGDGIYRSFKESNLI